MRHEIKIWPEFYEDVIEGRKKAEIRNNDRDYKAGDIVCIGEWSDTELCWTGREVDVVITHVLNGVSGLLEGYCMFSFKIIY